MLFCSTFVSEPVSFSTQKASNFSATLPKVDTGQNGGPPLPSPPSYIARTTHALQSVAEEHWKRQMSLEHEKEKVMMNFFLKSLILSAD